MDLFLPIVLFIVFCVLFSICGWCCKKHREGTVYGYAGNQPNVTVSSQPASTVIPPYPVDTTRHPQPHVAPPGPGFAAGGVGGYQATPYPAAYPPPPAPGFCPMPIAGGYPPAAPYATGGAPYPSTGTPYPPANTAPYPPANTAPYPPANTAPYPPASSTTPYPAQQLPPSYHEAVGQPPPPSDPHLAHDGYTKQSPYNPGY